MGFTVSHWVIIPLFLSSFFLIVSSINDFPTANLSTLWTNNDSLRNSNFLEYSHRIVLFNENKTDSMNGMGCGFVTDGANNGYYFTVFAVTAVTAGISIEGTNLQVFWTANRNKPVQENATLELTSQGDLVLKDVDGSPVWSTNTSGDSVVGMRIGGDGNLILYNASNATIWQSFDHPTDTWLPGQRLTQGQKLVARASASNFSAGPIYVQILNDGLYAFIESNPSTPLIWYARYGFSDILREARRQVIVLDTWASYVSLFVYLRLDSDGHFRAYTFEEGMEEAVDDLFSTTEGNCSYPTVCGVYGICSDGHCTCPQGGNESTSYFMQVHFRDPSLGCVRRTPLSLENMQTHTLVQLDHVDYFNFVNVHINVSMESCKQDCLKSPFCEAAVFRYNNNFSTGNCSLLKDIFSLKTNTGEGDHYNSTTFVKVQRSSSATNPKTVAKANSSTSGVLVSAVFAFGVITASALLVFCLRRKSLKMPAERRLYNHGECSIEQISGMPMRFSIKDLQLATGYFSEKLGKGGSGSVFEGYIDDITRIAVKRLDDLGHGRKQFLAEVAIIGCVHHVNLVRLIGFCAEENHNLLVYEYMCNGSLDKWIFHRNQEMSLKWETRKKIIISIAKGLSYLHEECQKTIVHSDIKPQNILLDENFNAKVADFGLAMSIDKDESQILTPMRGTRGYLAPEWFSNKRISEKVDVYSFGVVLLEIVCGRKNLDYGKESLLHLVKGKAETGQLFDIVDKQCKDIENHREEAVNMIRTAIWCLHGDCGRRPSMAMVLKVFEGVMDVVDISDYSFLTLSLVELSSDSGTEPPSACILSGPR